MPRGTTIEWPKGTNMDASGAAALFDRECESDAEAEFALAGDGVSEANEAPM